MSAVNCVISSLIRAFACIGRTIWRIVRPAPQLIIYLHVPNRIHRQEIFLAPVPKPIYTPSVPSDTEDIWTINPIENNEHLNQEIDIGEIENQHRVLVHRSAEGDIEDESIYEIQTEDTIDHL